MPSLPCWCASTAARGAAPRPASSRLRPASDRRAPRRAAPRRSWPPPRAGRTSCRRDSPNSSAAWRARNWPAPRRAWRSCRRSGFRDCEIAASQRAIIASFCASWASSDSCTRMASTSPFFTRSPSSTFSSSTRKPSTSGATRISSRGTSDPETVTISVKSACVALTTDTAGGGASLVVLMSARLRSACAGAAQVGDELRRHVRGRGISPQHRWRPAPRG